MPNIIDGFTKRRCGRFLSRIATFASCILALIGIYSVIGGTSSASAVSSNINLDLINGIAIRILDSTASSTTSDLVFDIDASSSGTFASNNVNVEVDTSNRTGYKLYMTSDYQVDSSYTTELVNIANPDYTIPTLSSTVSKSAFSSGGDYVNRWGYSLDDTTYNPIPEHTTSDLLRTTSATAIHEDTPVYIAMNINLAKAAGTYKNTLVFSAIANPIPTSYTLSFNLDGGSAPTSDPDAFDDMTASEVASSHTFTIPSTVPELTGYTFSYWTDTAGNQYNPGDTITVIGNEEYVGQETLTANYIEATPISGCAAASVGDIYTSNGVLYIKLADNNCYTKNSQGSTTWANASSLCPTGTHLPSSGEFNTLLVVGKYSGGDLYSASGWFGGYWSSTSYDSSRAYNLSVSSNNAYIKDYLKTFSSNVVCMAG